MKIKLMILCAALMLTACGEAADSKADEGSENSVRTTTAVTQGSSQQTQGSSAADSAKPTGSAQAQSSGTDKAQAELTMRIGETKVDVDWQDNSSVEALKELAKDKAFTVQMSKYGGFEQVGSLGRELVSEDENIVTGPGDIMLYSSDRIVVFYGSNSWEYTRLGKIKDKTDDELKELLGNDDTTITLSFE